MTTLAHNMADGTAAEIKRVPQDCAIRDRLRAAAPAVAAAFGRETPPGREQLEAAARELLAAHSLPAEFLGFAMVALDNAFWLADFEAVPFRRRLLLLPKCLSNSRSCPATIDTVGLNCAGCGACEIAGLKTEAESLGYTVIVAEGTSSVILKVLEGAADGILGVACLDSLEKSFERIADLGIPHQAIPLLTDGCQDTVAEVTRLRQTLHTFNDRGVATVRRSYLPLLRATHHIFEPTTLDGLLATCTCPHCGEATRTPATRATDAIAREWLRLGGKRLRPFITLAAYAVGKYGPAALAPTAPVADLLPPGIRQIAVAIEALHKASLVHDDIEDHDAFRYGRPTIHREHGLDIAINVGDYLVGLGYKLIADRTDDFGAEAIAAILQRLAVAHLQLCCGQGTELLWDREASDQLRPLHALQIGALKTAPAFEVALYAGLRSAGVELAPEALSQFASYIGEGYQVRDDLADWEEDGSHRQSLGRDFVAGRPTILQAFAVEAGGSAELEALAAEGRLQEEAEVVLERVREVYERLGAFAKAELLYARLRQRALELAGQLGDPALQELLRFLVRNILPQRPLSVSIPPD